MELYQDNSIVLDDLVLRQERADVYDDYTADKALERLEQAKRDFDRAKEIGLRRIEEITAQMQAAEERYQKIAQPIKQQLTAYLRTADCRETKTRYSYQLLSGKVILKKPTQKLVPDRKAPHPKAGAGPEGPNGIPARIRPNQIHQAGTGTGMGRVQKAAEDRRRYRH